MPVFEITKQATFDAAHHFPNEPEGSIYRRVHGHSFTVEATIRSETLDAEHNWVADLGALDRALKTAADQLDHGMLNEHEGWNCPAWRTCVCGSSRRYGPTGRAYAGFKWRAPRSTSGAC